MTPTKVPSNPRRDLVLSFLLSTAPLGFGCQGPEGPETQQPTIQSPVNERAEHWTRVVGPEAQQILFRTDGRCVATREFDGDTDGQGPWESRQCHYTASGGELRIDWNATACRPAADEKFTFERSAKSLVVEGAGRAMTFELAPTGADLRLSEKETCFPDSFFAPSGKDWGAASPDSPKSPVADGDLPEGWFPYCGKQFLDPTTNVLTTFDWQQGTIDLDGKGTYHMNSKTGSYTGSMAENTLIMTSGPLREFSAEFHTRYSGKSKMIAWDGGFFCERYGKSHY
jgi:hypothetical protein